MKKLGAKKATAGDLLQFDDSHTNAVPDDPYLRMNAEQLQAKQYVPPPTAPEQDKHVPVQRPETGAGHGRRCAWFPLCDSKVSVCRGATRASCLRMKNGEVCKPVTQKEWADFERKRRAITAESVREKRSRKKAKND